MSGYLAAMDTFPPPGTAPASVVAPALGRGPQCWTGAPSAAFDDGGRRMYVSLATPNTKHWWIGVVSAPSLEELPGAPVETAFAGDEDTAVKDPVIRLRDGVWHAWVCCHLLDLPGEEDRMDSAYATSSDGLTWDWHGTVLEGRPGEWDQRGARLCTVLRDGRAAYDGRASAEENWFERTGLVRCDGNRFVDAGEPVFDARYLEVLALDGGYRIYYEARLEDESTSCAGNGFRPPGSRFGQRGRAPRPWRYAAVTPS
jgi:hypothetical protein